MVMTLRGHVRAFGLSDGRCDNKLRMYLAKLF